MTEISSPAHRYKVGETVTVLGRAFDRSIPPGSYTVSRLLPADGGDNQYRVKSARNNHERVVKESQIG